MKTIDYKKFVEYVHDNFKDTFTAPQVDHCLSLEDNYNKDSPASLGKSLVVSRLKFSGTKNNGDHVNYDKPFSKGLTVWIAENGRGKSSIFKIIKYCLTGDNSVKKDVKPWLKEIWLEFKISETNYTIFINKAARASEGALYPLSIADIEAAKNAGQGSPDERRLFSFKGDEALEDHLQAFFFNQFAYYSLKYMQKAGPRDDLSLKTSNLSWKTYFKTIYLEPAEHESLFLGKDYGKQGTKIFEMIMGLRLTYPINQLTLRMNREEEEIGKLRIAKEIAVKSAPEEVEKLKAQLKFVENKLASFTAVQTDELTVKQLVEEQVVVQQALNNKMDALRKSQQAYQRALTKKRQVEQEIADYGSDELTVVYEINRLEKQVLNLQVYRDVEVFFTNLDIKTCPHCEEAFTNDRFSQEKEKHACGLCGSTNLAPKIDPNEIEEKINTAKSEIEGYKLSAARTKEKQSSLQQNLEKIGESVEKLYKESTTGNSVKDEGKRLEEISEQLSRIQRQRALRKQQEDDYDTYKQQKTILTYRIGELEQAPVLKQGNHDEEIEKRVLKKQLLHFSIEALKTRRQQLNREIIVKLETLMLREIHAFGITTFAKATITEDYNISFLQNEETVLFDELTESERLRVKFAFYLSLIQLDIEFKLGRHPRFLVIDSPGSEEISKKNLDGLSSIFKEVNSRFGNELQIFIGTALPEFTDVTLPEQTYLTKPDEYIF